MTRRLRTSMGALASVLLVSALVAGEPSEVAPQMSPKEQLGRAIFFDENLSEPKGQSCASCHDPRHGYNGNGDPGAAVMPGAMAGRFGSRNPPSAAYAFASPAPGYRLIDGEWTYLGGQFWDGRAGSLAEQAKAPFLNPAEMNNPNPAAVVEKVCGARYGVLFRLVYGSQACISGSAGLAYDAVADALAAFERSAEVNSFSSKYDAFLAGKGQLTPQERRGLALFEGKAGCSGCHPSGPQSPFTDFTYDNIGIPRNAKLPPSAPDLGLGVRVSSLEDGRFKVPTLRNVAIAPPYGHNGYFRTLKEVVHFYNTRDTDPRWPAPEVLHNVNREELGNLGLTEEEEDAIVAFLETLTDRGRGPH